MGGRSRRNLHWTELGATPHHDSLLTQVGVRYAIAFETRRALARPQRGCLSLKL